MDKKQIRKINKTAAVVATVAVILMELLYGFLLWLGDFDFMTRRPALAFAVGWALAKAIMVFWITLGLVAGLLTEACALQEHQQSRNP